MDAKTSAALCILDLAPLIEAGNFREFRLAEAAVIAVVRSAPTDWHRGKLLYHLRDQLDRFDAGNRPECDGYLRAIKAVARHLGRERFERSARYLPRAPLPPRR